MQTDRAADRSTGGLTLREARPFGPLRGSAADAARSLVAASRLAWSIEANWTQPLYLVVFLAIRPLAFLGLFLAVFSIGGRLDVASIGFVVVGQAVFQIVGAALQGPTHALLDDRERYRTIRYIFATPSSLLPVSVGRALVKAAIAGSSALIVIVSGVALGMPLRGGGVDLPLLLVVVPLGLLSIVGIGVALGAVCVQLRNDAWQYPEAVAGTVFLLCGAIFPLEVLPGPVQAIGAALPITWWIEGVRRALLGVASPGRLGTIPTEELVAILAVGTVVIWAAAPRLFTFAINRAREKGHLDRNTAS
ncbi:MAG: ABC transporter permease [Chloroflexi bacterium]|nr:MAG: ABC transporter permease [Chloroflexota bacterium]